MSFKVIEFIDRGSMSDTYVVKADNGEAFVVDPGLINNRFEKTLEDEGITELKYILLTHGHFDHIMDAQTLREKYGGKICIHAYDAPCLTDSEKNLGFRFGFVTPGFKHDMALIDRSVLPFGDSEIQVIHTPGHTIGSVCYKLDDCLFTGDTLFCMCIGRMDFPGGSETEMKNSLRKLNSLEGDYRIYPGHNEPTTLDFERKHNPYMKGI